MQVAKRRVGRYPRKFRRMAVERLKTCDNIVELARELGAHGRLLYKWRDQLDHIEESDGTLLARAIHEMHASSLQIDEMPVRRGEIGSLGCVLNSIHL